MVIEGCLDGSGLYPKDLEKFLKPSKLNPTPVTLPPPFPGLARRQNSGRFKTLQLLSAAILVQ